MTDLLNKIKNDRVDARADGDKVKLSILGTLLGELENKPDTDPIAIIKKFIKDINFSLEQDLASPIFGDLEEEILLLTAYLPKQLTLKDIDGIVSGLVNSGSNMGEVQKHFRDNYQGQFDGKLVAQCVKSHG